MGGVAPLYYALKGGSYFIHRIFYFFSYEKRVQERHDNYLHDKTRALADGKTDLFYQF